MVKSLQVPTTRTARKNLRRESRAIETARRIPAFTLWNCASCSGLRLWAEIREIARSRFSREAMTAKYRALLGRLSERFASSR